MNTNGYNGWINYETWAVALWINNEEGSYIYWRKQATEVGEEVCQDALDRGDDLDSKEVMNAASYDLAEVLKDSLEEGAPEAGGLYHDLLQSALQEVNYREISRNLLDEVWGDVMASVKSEAQ